MNNKVILYSSILLLSVLVSSISQVLLKKASIKQYQSKLREYLNITVALAYFLFFLSTLLTVIAYRGVSLSLGAVLESTSYIYVTIFGVKLFGEQVTRRKAVSLFCIILGITIYAWKG